MSRDLYLNLPAYHITKLQLGHPKQNGPGSHIQTQIRPHHATRSHSFWQYHHSITPFILFKFKPGSPFMRLSVTMVVAWLLIVTSAVRRRAGFTAHALTNGRAWRDYFCGREPSRPPASGVFFSRSLLWKGMEIRHPRSPPPPPVGVFPYPCTVQNQRNVRVRTLKKLWKKSYG